MAWQSIKFIDIGANLLDSMYQGVYNDKIYHRNDLATVLDRSWKAHVMKMIITSGNLEESKRALQLARSDPRLYCTVGVHPTRASEIDSYPDGAAAYLAQLRHVIKDGLSDCKVVAIGECGLDYDRQHFCDIETQKKWFDAQFSLVEEFKLPMFLHLRNATNDFLNIIASHCHTLEATRGGVVHSFDGTQEDLDKVLAFKQLSIGINGCSLKTEENLEVVKHIPRDRLMLETDCPWCQIRSTHASSQHVKTEGTTPWKDKKKYDDECMVKGRNEPSMIIQVAEVVAAVQGTDVETVAQHAMDNTEKMFFAPR